MKFLLDTNVIAEIRKRDRTDRNVARWVGATPFTEIGTSVLVLAEIRRGIELKRRHDVSQAEAMDRSLVRANAHAVGPAFIDDRRTDRRNLGKDEYSRSPAARRWSPGGDRHGSWPDARDPQCR